MYVLFSDIMRTLYPISKMDQQLNNLLVLAKLERNKDDFRFQLREIRANREEMEKRVIWQKERISKINREKDQLKAQLLKLIPQVVPEHSTMNGEQSTR